MKHMVRRSDRIVWLSPRALVAAEHLSGLTGVRIPDLVELLLLELESGLCDAALDAAEVPPRSSCGPAHVIPIERARRRPVRVRPAPLVRRASDRYPGAADH